MNYSFKFRWQKQSEAGFLSLGALCGTPEVVVCRLVGLLDVDGDARWGKGGLGCLWVGQGQSSTRKGKWIGKSLNEIDCSRVPI
jgi:hypothetical protein